MLKSAQFYFQIGLLETFNNFRGNVLKPEEDSDALKDGGERTEE